VISLFLKIYVGEQDKGTEPNPGNLLKKMGREQVITDKSDQQVRKIVLNELKRLGRLFKPKVTKQNPTEPLVYNTKPISNSGPISKLSDIKS
jgi:hypothetical protein